MGDGSRAQLVFPLDGEILKLLPAEGTLLGKYQPLTLGTKAITRMLDDEHVTSAKVHGRMSVLKLKGLVVRAGTGYQRTTAGDELLRERGFVREPEQAPQPTDDNYDTQVREGWLR